MDVRSWKEKAKQLKNEVYVLYLASKHPGTPWYAKVFAVFIIGYALSPFDLIPDFIPVLGYLDDLLLIPVGVTLLIKMIPREILEECREKARSQFSSNKPKNWIAGIIIILIWVSAVYFTLRIVGKLFI